MLSIKEEKKVEYLELIYDLIFVYMIGRNNSLLETVGGGFVTASSFSVYVLCTLAIIQIWSFTTFYINMFGRNGPRDHVFLLINMYLMYFIGQATRSDWHAFQAQYHIAWALILINIGLQYAIELRNHQMDVWNRDLIKRMMLAIFSEAVIVLIGAFPSPQIAVLLSFAAIAVGILLTFVGKTRSAGGMVDFTHLTERAMLYVVFTFGEMIIAIASYFEGDGSLNRSIIYFSAMAFLIVVGLFLSYELVYDHLLDREKEDNGLLYMLTHIFIIFSLNNITSSLEFMREPEIALMPKVIFLTVSIICYYFFLFMLGHWAKRRCTISRRFIVKLAAVTVIFAAAMLLLRYNMWLNIFVTVMYIMLIVNVLYSTGVKTDKAEYNEEDMTEEAFRRG